MGWMRGGVAMNPLTAVALFAAAAALWLVRREPPAPRARRAATVLAAAVVVAAAGRLASYGLGSVLEFDAWLAGGHVDPDGTPNRMAPNTAAAFILAGAALLALDTRRHRLLAACAGGTLLLALMAILGYAFGGPPLTGLRGFIPMALNTAAAFALLGLGTLAARWQRGPLALLVEDGPGSALARRIIPWAIVAAVALGLLLREALRAGWLDVGAGMAVLALVLLVGLVTVVLWAARSLNRTDAERRQFFELSQDLLAVADFSGHFVELNPQWERVLGWTREELMRRPFIELVHPDDVATTLAEYARANAGDPVLRFTNRYRTKDGDYRWLEWCATTIPALRRGFAVARDVTELRRLERDLQARVADLAEANHELEAFSYSVSHDLRAPLRHIVGFTRLLGEQRQGLGEEARRWIDIIQASTRRMGQLIDDLLTFSRIGRAALAAAPVDLTALAARAWEDVTQGANGRRVRWTLRPLPAVQGDAALLHVALVNLLSNAFKYSGTRPVAEVTVDGWVEGDDAVIEVRDNGVGFDMRYADKLFGVFQRLHAREDFEGTGIGLATVRRVIQRHGGRITAQGEVDRGAVFRVVLPAAPREAAP
jgi:PAS domain S-box-containing protein